MRYLQDEHLQAALRFLFLSMAITVMKQDMAYIRDGKFKIKEPYLELLEKMIFLAKKERKNLRKTMHDENIQVILLNRNDSFSSYLFICQGKEEKRNFFNPAIRKKVEIIVKEMMEKALQSFPLSPVH
ncbi:hypothetical protein GCM10010978_10770 [Compostibacillus humi]|uniref:Uncharacterized protein n=1 Tax=Compostibacillus humi TaxID=1245525 RepID=A0A8J2ZRW2_9BACI|nr:hypothetical protein [Compostibacillus humi]GGH73166.1 hypothetical protein GCM10010978_10770 [Compostibacillus humi]